jgi:predicted lactoylglutathione lyase
VGFGEGQLTDDPTMSGRLSYLTLAVADISATANFYEQLFGWCREAKSSTTVFFHLPELTVALMNREALSKFTGAKTFSNRSIGPLISWNVDSTAEVVRLVETANALGATVEKPAHELDWGGYAGIILTSDGHLWEIVWNPKRQ